MAGFDSILGYGKQVRQLKEICDYLKNTEKYEKFGIKIPSGVFIYGEEGVGKSLFAKALAAECNRYVSVPADRSVRSIKKAIKRAKKSAPSVIILDDMDCYLEESCELICEFIGQTDGNEVFAVITFTDMDEMPEPLTQSNAFERIILETPDFEDAKLIYTKRFKNKKIDSNMDMDDFCCISQEWTVSMADEAYRHAAIIAASEGKDYVNADHLFRAMVKLNNKSLAEEFIQSTAYHEAGHAAVHLLLGGDAAYIVMLEGGGGQYCEKKSEVKSYKDKLNRYMVVFGGNACEQVFGGDIAIGGCTDLDGVAHNIERDNKDLGCHGFEYYDSTELSSPSYNDALAKKVQKDMQSYYDAAKKMLEDNKPLVTAIVEKLKEKRFLLHSEIHRIYESYIKSKS